MNAFMQRQGKLLNEAMRSQEETNVRNLRKRYANYKRLPERMRRKREKIEEDDEEPRDSPTSIAHIIVSEVKPVQPIFITKEMDRGPSGPGDIHTISRRERHGARSG